jgi:cation transport ATPase
MRKKSVIFLVVNFFICILLWMLLVKLAYFFDIELWRYHTVPLVVFFLITLAIDFVLLLMLNIASKKILINTLIEVGIIYLIIWFFLNGFSYN